MRTRTLSPIASAPCAPSCLPARCSGSCWPGAPGSVLAQSRDQPDFSALAADVAKKWAKDMVRDIRSSRRRDEAGDRIALQPLNSATSSLNDRQRRQLYEWMLNGLHDEAQHVFDVVDRESFHEIYRVMEDVDVKDLDARYHKALRQSLTKLNISCRETLIGNWIALNCTATNIENGDGLGRESARFNLDWLTVPIARDLAIGSIAKDIVERLPPQGGVDGIRIVDVASDGESELSIEIAESLRVEIIRRMTNRRAWRPVGSGDTDDATGYRLEGKIRSGERKLILDIAVYRDDTMVHAVREYADVPAIVSKVRIHLPDKGFSVTPADWALLREDDLKAGRYEELLVEAKSHIEKHGPLPPLVTIRDKAVSGLVGRIRVETKVDARRELTRILRIQESAGDWPDLLRLKARAHRLLGDYSSEKATHERWLDVAPETHSDRREVLSAFMLARAVVAQGERFSAALGRPHSESSTEESTGWTDLHHAALLNLPGVVHALIEAGMVADSRLAEGTRFGDELKRTLVDLGHGGEFDLWNAGGETPLMIAALADSREAAEFLLERGADPRARNSRGSTPLHFAALSDARETAEFLLDRRAEVNAKDEDDFTPLHRAASVDALQVAQLLLARGADGNSQGAHGKTPLHRAAWHGAVEVARLLVEREVDIHAREPDGDTPLHNAASVEAREVAELLLDRGAEIDPKNGQGKTPLHRAAWRNAVGTARMLVDRGADVMVRAIDGSTALHFAARGNASGIAELLLARDAEVDATDKRGRTPLLRAAWSGAVETASLLVERGADVRARAIDGSTPLHLAARRDAPGVAELLLDRGAEIGAKDQDGRTALEVAVEAEAHEVEAVLIRHMDDAAFSRARGLNTVSSYDAYLGSYPRGPPCREGARAAGGSEGAGGRSHRVRRCEAPGHGCKLRRVREYVPGGSPRRRGARAAGCGGGAGGGSLGVRRCEAPGHRCRLQRVPRVVSGGTPRCGGSCTAGVGEGAGGGPRGVRPREAPGHGLRLRRVSWFVSGGPPCRGSARASSSRQEPGGRRRGVRARKAPGFGGRLRPVPGPLSTRSSCRGGAPAPRRGVPKRRRRRIR